MTHFLRTIALQQSSGHIWPPAVNLHKITFLGHEISKLCYFMQCAPKMLLNTRKRPLNLSCDNTLLPPGTKQPDFYKILCRAKKELYFQNQIEIKLHETYDVCFTWHAPGSLLALKFHQLTWNFAWTIYLCKGEMPFLCLYIYKIFYNKLGL